MAEGVEVRAPRGQADWEGYLSAIQRSFTGDPTAWRDWSEVVRAHVLAKFVVKLPIGLMFVMASRGQG